MSRFIVTILDSGVGWVIDKGREQFRTVKDSTDQKLVNCRVNAILANRGRLLFFALDLAEKAIEKLEVCVESAGDKADEIIDHLCNQLTDHR